MRFLAARTKQGLLVLATLLAGSLISLPAAAQADAQQWIASALASQSLSGPTCADPALSQPFTAWKDQNYYTLAPGQSDSNFTGEDWLLLGGANIQQSTLADGSTGNVLDLPSGSLAISPPMCVDVRYPTARTMVQNVTGGGGVHAFISYAGTSTWGKPRDGGAVHGKDGNWALSDPIHLQPSHDPGWQLVRFGLVPDGKNSEFLLYNLYVDPYAKR
ncbi:MAG: hypothetical protein ACJ764_05250 [Solirubrobacteraceae bacterium]